MALSRSAGGVIVAPDQLPGVLRSLAPILDRYGYIAIIVAITLEGCGVPSFGETTLIASAVYAGAGRLNLAAVVILSMLAAIMGDNIGYAIGRFGGWPLLRRFGRYVLLTEKRLEKVEVAFRRHGGKAVIIARFFTGLRQANGVLAGASHMPWRRFLAYNAAGAALWVAVWVSLGYLAGRHVGTIYTKASRYSLYLLIATIAVILVVLCRHLIRRRAAAPEQAAVLARTPPQDGG